MEAALSVTRVKNRFMQNHEGFWHDYRWIIPVFILALFCDAVSTIYFMNIIGVEAELHPGFYYASKMFGPFLGPLFGATWKAIGAVTVAIYCRKFAAYIFMSATIISFWAAWYNFWGMHFYSPMLLEWIPW
jgi:hypothetical protein